MSAQVSMENVLCNFATLEDPRSEVNRKHPLASVVVIAIMVILAGAAGPTAIAQWAKVNANFLLSYVPLPNGVPRKDVFRRLLCALKPGAFQACFLNWVESLRSDAEAATGIDRPTYAVDGKTLRRSHDHKKGLAALHCVSVWASEFGITLAVFPTEQKSNEITAIPQVLQLVDLNGTIITIDAIGTQKEISKTIVDEGGDYVLALKGNQGTLNDEVREYVVEQMENDFADIEVEEIVTEENSHGRIETRQVIQMPAPESLSGFSQWLGLATIGVAILTCIRNGVPTTDVRFFISSLSMGVKQFAHSIRSHWGIENSCHLTLDLTYREDESRTRQKNVRDNLAWIYRFTLSLLKQLQGKQSIAGMRRECAWNPDLIVQVLTGTRSWRALALRLHRFTLAAAFFVTRAKRNLNFGRHARRIVDKATGLRPDYTIVLLGVKSSQQYPATLQRVAFVDPISSRRLVFLPNNFELHALTIALLYKSRWLVELFFKWIKQHL